MTSDSEQLDFLVFSACCRYYPHLVFNKTVELLVKENFGVCVPIVKERLCLSNFPIGVNS